MLLAGTAVFGALVVGLVPRNAREDPQLDAWRRQTAGIAWASLATAVLSGAAWLVVLAADIGGRTLHDVFADNIVQRVVTETRFGFVWSVRFVLALLLAFGLLVLGAATRRARRAGKFYALSTLALTLLGSLAWSGHASGTPGIAGVLHISADVLHLVAAGVWVGSLLPLALLFAAARRTTDPAVASLVRDATWRFSALGVIAVGTLLVTGVINTCVLVGSIPALIGTDYGCLLVAKMCLFIAMVCIAAFNRMRFAPRLSSAATGADAQRQLQRNSLIEASMGVLILFIVGALGTLPPAVHAMPSMHVHGISSRVKGFAPGAILASAMWQNRPVQIMGHSSALPQRAGPAAQSRRRVGGAGAVGVWLLVCCALVFAMVVVGGVTRLTHSGLSITEWQPIVGTLPPLSAADWNDAFAKYQATPEYAQVNKGMSIDAFKSIFWWEYFHRLLGRAIGVVFFVPLLWFVARDRIPPGYAPRLFAIFLLGGLQGALGWYMVQSGLVDDPRVSQLRLTAHLGLAFLIFGAMFWTALSLLRSPPERPARMHAEPRVVALRVSLRWCS